MNPERVEDGEKLGHGVFASNDARPDKLRARFFEDAINYAIKNLDGRMSVDRLTYADMDILRAVHDDDALRRGQNRSFYGWHWFTSDAVRAMRLDVEPSPSTDHRNIWHADVLFAGRAALILRYANALYSACKPDNWEPRPLNAQLRNDVEQASGGTA